MSDALHLIIGPAEHGVVQHAEMVADACGHRVLRAARPGDVADIPPTEVVHVAFTDRLFGHSLDQATDGFEQIAARVADAGAELSVTLHDVPHGSSALQAGRRELYRAVLARARGVVVNSRLELSLIEDDADHVHSLRLAPLPVAAPVRPAHGAIATDQAPTVTVLGFIYPDRGYEDVLAALPPRARLLAVGRPSDGHDDLVRHYASIAPEQWRCTGYLDPADLSVRLWTADVPVAPNRRVTASGSINTWLAHGRRPLVPDSPYVRELVAERGAALTVYDPDEPASLRAALLRALADPASTWLGSDTFIGPSIDDVALIYREHLAACAPPSVIRGRDNRALAPGNRWDLLVTAPTSAAPTPREPPTVSVVIPYFEAQAQLDRTLVALTRQTHPLDRLQVVIADDGSRQPPDLTCARGLAVEVVGQDDLGFRAARARNLGAAAADGDVLVFLDADTTPEPAFVSELTRLPYACPDVVTVGRRRHADLGGLAPGDQPSNQLDGSPRLLPEPEWLRSAYERSADLLSADRRSYRFVISAVLAVGRELFTDVAGFDERFVGYGGEDWEFAHRCWAAGALLAHVPTAVAWHDGVDWAGRHPDDAASAKNAETTILATLLPDPDARGRGQWFPYPAIVARAATMSGAELLVTARSAFACGADVQFWIAELHGPHVELVLADPRLHLGTPPADVAARAQWLVDLRAPCDLSSLPQLCEVTDRHGEVTSPALRIRSSRAAGRVRRRAATPAQGAYLFGQHDRSAPPALAAVDLASALARC